LISYGSDISQAARNEISVDLNSALESGRLLRHADADVAVGRLGTIDGNKIELVTGCAFISKPGLVGVSRDSGIELFKDVLISNDCYIFGYPNSLSFAPGSQFDYDKPLLRKGIVAGTDAARRTLILDCPVYWGNSGGPVVQVSHIANAMILKVIGVVSQFIPLVETWTNARQGIAHNELINSGYSVAVSMDPVIELIDQMS
jgi:hypothetical protein